MISRSVFFRHVCVVLLGLTHLACSDDPNAGGNDASGTADAIADGAGGDVSEQDGTIADGSADSAQADAGADSAQADAGTDAAADAAADAVADAAADAVADAEADADSAADAATDADADADAAAADSTDTGGSGAWQLPSCTTPTGAPGVAFGPNGGKTLQIASTPLAPGKSYTMGLAAAGTPGLLYAEHAGTVYRSTDGGCAWAAIGTTQTTPTRMVPSPGGRVYGFYDNGSELYRVEGTTVTTLKGPTANILGVAATSADGLRVGGTDGQLWDNNAGGSGPWTQVGTTPNPGGIGYRVAISALDRDRVLYGVMQKGIWVTHDGAKTWSLATFQGAIAPQKVNGMNAVFSPLEEDVAWAMAIDLNESLQQPSKTNGKYLWRSTDGGKTFTKVVAHLQPNDVTLTNGTHLIPDPTDAKVLRWTFGTCFSGYGTNLYRYDDGATTDKLTWVNHPIPGISELIHHPADPTTLVLGLRGDDNPQCP
ncbi:MAG: dispase autolysis-inducing protein [Deltaproteobacteria bacterium]|nr:dispase autolysis-inducing protein [Deltaproteobacteria bacterium]